MIKTMTHFLTINRCKQGKKKAYRSDRTLMKLMRKKDSQEVDTEYFN